MGLCLVGGDNMINFSKEQRDQFKNLEINVENLVKNFEAEPNDKGKEFQKIKVDKITDMSFDEAFKNTEKYLIFEVSSTKKLQEVILKPKKRIYLLKTAKYMCMILQH